jgi:uncharacterized protein (DUF952 family)
MSLIFKLLAAREWQSALAAGVFAGSAVDLADGYIHFSTADQAPETARRYFAGLTDILLVALETERLGEALVWEPSRGGDLFPHLYGTLDPALAVWVRPAPLDDQGLLMLGDLAGTSGT